jgi:hypothetical protein
VLPQGIGDQRFHGVSSFGSEDRSPNHQGAARVPFDSFFPNALKARELGASVHIPRIGCGLAGGEWSKGEPLIGEHLCGAGVAVTV